MAPMPYDISQAMSTTCERLSRRRDNVSLTGDRSLPVDDFELRDQLLFYLFFYCISRSDNRYITVQYI